MAAMTKIDSFITELLAGAHVAAVNGADTDVLRLALSNSTPVSTWDVLTDITPIAYTNISEAWPIDATNTAVDTSGTVTVSGVDVTATATGVVPTFRYVWLYNDTQGDRLIGYWDNLSAVDLTTGQVFTVNFDTDTLFTVE